VRRMMSSNEASAVASTSSTAPSVYDVSVKLTFVDDEGSTRVVPGIVGKNIWETAQMHGIDLGPSSCGHPVEAVRSDTWTEPLYGEGPTTGFDHVLIVGNGVETAGPMTWKEKVMLREYWGDAELSPESRLASQVILTKEMDGLSIFVPDRLVDDYL